MRAGDTLSGSVVKHFSDTEYGAVDALEHKDLLRIQPVIRTLQTTWFGDVIRRQAAGEAAGLFALAPAILVHYVPARGGKASVQRRVVLSPGVTYGSDLWEPLVPTLLAALRAVNVTQPIYDRGLCTELSVMDAQAGAAGEIMTLRQRLIVGQ